MKIHRAVAARWINVAFSHPYAPANVWRMANGCELIRIFNGCPPTRTRLLERARIFIEESLQDMIDAWDDRARHNFPGSAQADLNLDIDGDYIDGGLPLVAKTLAQFVVLSLRSYKRCKCIHII